MISKSDLKKNVTSTLSENQGKTCAINGCRKFLMSPTCMQHDSQKISWWNQEFLLHGKQNYHANHTSQTSAIFLTQINVISSPHWLSRFALWHRHCLNIPKHALQLPFSCIVWKIWDEQSFGRVVWAFTFINRFKGFFLRRNATGYIKWKQHNIQQCNTMAWGAHRSLFYSQIFEQIV